MAGNEEPGRVGWSSTARSSARFLTAVNLRMELTIMSSMREAKPASARAMMPAVASTVWKRGAGPQAGALDDLAQPTAARVHRLHRCLWLLVTWSWIGVSSVAQRLGSRWIGVVGRLYYMRVQTRLHSHRAGSILLLQLIPSACN